MATATLWRFPGSSSSLFLSAVGRCGPCNIPGLFAEYMAASAIEERSFAAGGAGVSLTDENGMGIAVQRPGNPSSLASFADGPDHEWRAGSTPTGSGSPTRRERSPASTSWSALPRGAGAVEGLARQRRIRLWSADGNQLYYTEWEPGSLDGELSEVAFDGSGSQSRRAEPDDRPRETDTFGPGSSVRRVLEQVVL